MIQDGTKLTLTNRVFLTTVYQKGETKLRLKQQETMFTIQNDDVTTTMSVKNWLNFEKFLPEMRRKRKTVPPNQIAF